MTIYHTWLTAGFTWAGATAYLRTWASVPLIAKGTYSDVTVQAGTIALTDFQNLVYNGRAPGFTNFRPFIQGDYNYRYAIFRTVATSINSDRARIDVLKLAVDVPDVNDRGAASITVASTGVYIPFNRIFHVIPQITVSLSGGLVLAIADHITDSTSGFWAILTDPVTGLRVTGNITWAAHGY